MRCLSLGIGLGILIGGFFGFPGHRGELWAQKTSQDPRSSLGFRIGQWQPLKIETKVATSLLKGIPGTSPYLGLYVSTPIYKDISLQVTMGRWSQNRFEGDPELKSVTIVPFEIEIKHLLIEGSSISPSFLYGGGIFLGWEQRSGSQGEYSRVRYWGQGLEIGTGLEVYLFHRIALNLQFHYQYVKFPQPIGQTDDYTGPKASAGMAILF